MAKASVPTTKAVGKPKPSSSKAALPADAGVRAVPNQARGMATFEHILEVTSKLLDEYGHEAITTNMIARVANVNIATLYKYFANKQAIIIELFDRQNSDRADVINELIESVRASEDWRAAFSTAIDAAAMMRARQPGSRSLRLAMRSSPELEERDRASSETIITTVQQALIDVAGLDSKRAVAVARCAMEMVVSLIDYWSLHPGTDADDLLEEAKRAVMAYLALYFEPETSDSSHER